MNEPERLPSVFARACELGAALGWNNIAKLPGCQEATISEEWWMAINPHPEPEKCRKGTRIPPFTIYFEFNGWPAGFVNAGGGTMAAGRIANEHRLLAAIEAAIEKTGAERWD
jgi:hypothetical protein